MDAQRLRYALAQYQRGAFSLERGAQYAGVPLHRFAEIVSERGTLYLRHSVEEQKEDESIAKEWFEREK